jgi:predicted metalloendopeptidase
MDFLDIEAATDKFVRSKWLLDFVRKGRTFPFMGYMVNAYYAPGANSINILGTLTQPPVYDPSYPTAYKFGGYGSILAHEIGHGT